MTFDISQGGAYAVLYTVLGLFTALACVASGFLGTDPLWEKLGCLLLPAARADAKGRVPDREERVALSRSADFFLAARNSAGWQSIALSFFASGMVRRADAPRDAPRSLRSDTRPASSRALLRFRAAALR